MVLWHLNRTVDQSLDDYVYECKCQSTYYTDDTSNEEGVPAAKFVETHATKKASCGHTYRIREFLASQRKPKYKQEVLKELEYMTCLLLQYSKVFLIVWANVLNTCVWHANF